MRTEPLNRYDDLLERPHPEPRRHPRMAPEARAAQFAPFAALGGLDFGEGEPDPDPYVAEDF